MELWVIKTDETDNWIDEIQKKAGKLYGIYLVDPNVNFHLCELTPSYEARFIDTYTENMVDDETDDEIREANAGSDQTVYYHTHSKFNIVEKWEIDGDGIEEYNEDRDEYIEGVLEHYAGNPPVC